jgi:hypothetical protein
MTPERRTAVDPLKPFGRTGMWLGVMLFLAALGFSLVRATVDTSAQLTNPDERLITFFVLDRFTGAAAMATEWPAASRQIVGVPVVAADYVLHNSISPRSFVRYLGRTYREPWHIVWLLRWIVAATCALGVALFGLAILRKTGDHWLATVSAPASSTIPMFWSHSRAATGDGMAIGFVLAAIGTLDGAQSIPAFIATGAFYGLAVTSKYPVALLSPLLLAFLFSVHHGKSVSAGRAPVPATAPQAPPAASLAGAATTAASATIITFV